MVTLAEFAGIAIALFVPLWACSAVRIHWNLAYAKYPVGFAAYFLLCSLVGFWVFRADFANAPIDRNVVTPALVLLITIVTTVGIYAYGQKQLADVTPLLQQYGPTNTEFVTLDYRYLIVRSCNILYQQVCLVLGVLLLHRLVPSVLTLALLFACLFGAAHLLLFSLRSRQKRVPRSIVLIFVVGACLGGLAMPLLILQVPFGFVYSLCLHVLYYPAIGVGFRVYLGRRAQVDETTARRPLADAASARRRP